MKTARATQTLVILTRMRNTTISTMHLGRDSVAQKDLTNSGSKSGRCGELSGNEEFGGRAINKEGVKVRETEWRLK